MVLAPPPLTARFEGKPSSHDGQMAFIFELHFSEEFGVSYATLRDHAFSVTGGTVNKAQRLTQGSNLGWRITVQPGGTAEVGETLTAETSGIEDEDGLDDATYSYQWIADDTDIEGATNSTYILADSDEGKAIKVRVSFDDDAGNEEALTSAATAAVAAVEPPLTARFEDQPSIHDGQTAFAFELHFSEEFGISYLTLRDQAFSVTNGTVTKAKRLTQGSNLGWRITVTPVSGAGVTVVLPETTDCNASGAVCTGDGRMLSNRNEFTVSEPGG